MIIPILVTEILIQNGYFQRLKWVEHNRFCHFASILKSKLCLVIEIFREKSILRINLNKNSSGELPKYLQEVHGGTPIEGGPDFETKNKWNQFEKLMIHSNWIHQINYESNKILKELLQYS